MGRRSSLEDASTIVRRHDEDVELVDVAQLIGRERGIVKTTTEISVTVLVESVGTVLVEREDLDVDSGDSASAVAVVNLDLPVGL